MPSCNVLGSVTAVTWLNVEVGFVGYAPGPNEPFMATPLTWLNRLNASSIASTRTRSAARNVRLSLAFTLKKSNPVPALRLMNVPFSVGRAVGP